MARPERLELPTYWFEVPKAVVHWLLHSPKRLILSVRPCRYVHWPSDASTRLASSVASTPRALPFRGTVLRFEPADYKLTLWLSTGSAGFCFHPLADARRHHDTAKDARGKRRCYQRCYEICPAAIAGASERAIMETPYSAASLFASS
jgi:hypothetical protein